MPAYSRPRGDRPVRGYATERGTVTPPIYPPYYPSYPSYPYYPYYPYYGYGYYPYYGLGFGLGFGWYDPFYDPVWTYGGGGGSYFGNGSDYFGGGSGESTYRGSGSLRLKVKPREAQVYVDGALVGEIDQFDGAFQKLTIDAGPHKVTLKADGYQDETFDVLVTPDETATYKGELKPLQ